MEGHEERGESIKEESRLEEKRGDIEMGGEGMRQVKRREREMRHKEKEGWGGGGKSGEETRRRGEMRGEVIRQNETTEEERGGKGSR